VGTGDLDLTDGESGEDEAFGKRTQRRIDENDAEMARRVREVAARARANGTARTVHSSEVRVRRATPEELERIKADRGRARADHGGQPNPIVEWLAANGGRGTAPRIAKALGRSTANVGTRLMQLSSKDPPRVRRTGMVFETGRGGPQVEWELVMPGDAAVIAADGRGDGAVITAEREELQVAVVEQSAGTGTDGLELSADDLQELYEGWAGSLTLAESTATTLRMALRVQTAIERLRGEK
jgi:hypothetical protein